jgi:hypothetical protein
LTVNSFAVGFRRSVLAKILPEVNVEMFAALVYVAVAVGFVLPLIVTIACFKRAAHKSLVANDGKICFGFRFCHIDFPFRLCYNKVA